MHYFDQAVRWLSPAQARPSTIYFSPPRSYGNALPYIV